uniref:Uncharacterized protein n=1 Tax=Cyclopterus lumpus TaxID=8103 RepID=A0A8C3G397_CYCLU
MTSTSTQGFPPRVAVSQRPFTTETPAVPVLLPYKPHGSEELFYMPQTEADVSSFDPSDTTMESSHTGSDDAVPPRFSSEVLGHRDAGLDRGVTIRHSEGIYSKRLKTATFKMHEPGHRGEPSAHANTAHEVVLWKLTNNSKTVSSVIGYQSAFIKQPESLQERPGDQPCAPCEISARSCGRRQGGPSPGQKRDSRLPPPAARQSSGALDQLWESFCEQWSLKESRPTSDREASLLERLERLSCLIHSSRSTNKSEGKPAWRGEDAGEVKRSVGCEARGTERKVRGGRKVEGEPPEVPLQAWTQRLQVQTTSPSADEDSRDSFTSSFSQISSPSRHLCPADRDESETLSTGSGSMSTVDTERLTRAFGAHRVQHLKTSSGLRKLYSTINKQKEGREQRRGRHKEPPHLITLLETTGTEESTVSRSAYSCP